jgi:5-hydroxyisourate hydrolase-like protein (transthyretin family)
MKKFICFLIAATVMLLSCSDDDKAAKKYEDLSFTVYDMYNNEPLSGVSLTLTRLSDNKLIGKYNTDENGKCSFTQLESGDYFVKAEKDDYETKTDTFPQTTNKKDEYDIQLKPTPATVPLTVTIVESLLDFGESSTTKQFSFLNKNNVALNWQIVYDCKWIKRVESLNGIMTAEGVLKGTIAKNGTVTITVIIDRDKLDKVGENTNNISVATFGSGGAMLLIKAIKYSSIGSVELPKAGIMVQEADVFSSYTTWTEANNLCNSSEIGGYTDWRLPNLTEISAIFASEELIGGFKHYGQSTIYHVYYWTETTLSEGNYYAVNIDYYDGFVLREDNVIFWKYGSDGVAAAWARCVRTLP